MINLNIRGGLICVRTEECPGPEQIWLGGGDPFSCFKFLSSWGGTWMWTDIVNEKQNLDWITAALRGGTDIWIMDGSYNKKIALYASGAGWILYCTSED